MNTCRTCLETQAEKDISELENGVDEDNKSCLDIMLFCLDIKIAEDSKITTNLCDDCYSKVVSFYKFKTQSLKNDAYLKSLDPVVKLVDHKQSGHADENEIKVENMFDYDEFDSNLVEDYEVGVDLKDEDLLGNVELDVEALSVVEQIKYEYIEEEIKENAPIHIEHSARKKECGPIKKEHSPRKKEHVLSKKDIGPKKKVGRHKKAMPGCAKQEKQMCEECGMYVYNLEEHSLRHKPKDERPKLQCRACPKQFLTKRGQSKHYRVSHLGKKSKCEICSKEVVSLSVHKLSVHNRAALPFGCVSCEQRFVSQSKLDFHMFEHTKVYPFECDICHKKFRCKSSLVKHILRVHEKVKRFQCHLCSKAFFVKERLDKHIRSHTNEGPMQGGAKQEQQMCEECGMYVKNLKEHSLRHKPRDERPMLQCRACPKQFLTKGGRSKHYRVSHLGKKSKCDICNKEVACLSVHKLSVHNRSAMPFVCVLCEQRFVSQSRLDFHMTEHTKVCPFECDICQKKFRCKSNLVKHIQGVHEKAKKFQCHLCSKAYFVKERFDTHMRSHTNERPYKCEECGKAFMDKKTLSNHMLLHSDVRAYRCKICDMTFQRVGYLSNHMISHTKEKKHPCQYCGVRFGRSDHRRRHEFTAHQKYFVKAENKN